MPNSTPALSKIEHHQKITIMGEKGFKTPKKHPLVPNLAHSAISKTLKGNISFQQSDLNERTTLRRGELLGIGRPIWLKVQESDF